MNKACMDLGIASSTDCLSEGAVCIMRWHFALASEKPQSLRYLATSFSHRAKTRSVMRTCLTLRMRERNSATPYLFGLRLVKVRVITEAIGWGSMLSTLRDHFQDRQDLLRHWRSLQKESGFLPWRHLMTCELCQDYYPRFILFAVFIPESISSLKGKSYSIVSRNINLKQAVAGIPLRLV